MHSDHATFIAALEKLEKVALTFFCQKHGRTLTSICAPMDYGPSRRTRDRLDRYHFWDYESDDHPHHLSLLPDPIVAIVRVDERFDPGEFVTWPPRWFYSRDWGPYS